MSSSLDRGMRGGLATERARPSAEEATMDHTSVARRWTRRAAAVALGALLAALLPAAPAQAATTTTVHGTVQASGTALAGVPVGFWSRTGHALATATTGSTGAFTLTVPSGVRGFAYAGARPDAAKAVFLIGSKPYIRGVIGATQGSTSYTLYQGHASATAADLAGGGALRFRLQKPGTVRVEGGTPFQGFLHGTAGIQVRRLNGAPFIRIDARPDTGVATSQRLVPGRYSVRLFPQAPYLARTVPVTVTAGHATVLRPAFVRGATVRGTLTTTTGQPAPGVRVTVGDLSTGRVATTDARGHYSITAVTAGRHALRIGYNPQPDPDAEEGPEEPSRVPPPTSDVVVPKTLSITVAADHATLTKDVTLTPAGRLRGRVSDPSFTRVWLEDADRQVVRVTEIRTTTGEYSFGGMRPGRTYTAYATSRDHPQKYGSVTVTATTGTLRRAIAITKSTLTLRGHATNAAGGQLAVEALPILWPRSVFGGGVDASGNYVVRGLIPGRYRITVSAPESARRVDSRPSRLTLTASTTKDFAAGPRASAYTARFLSGSAPAQRVLVQARSSGGDLFSFSTSVSRTATGRVTVKDLRPGTYSYLASSFRLAAFYDAPVSDGPWWFGAVASTFTLSAGRTTDDGTFAVHVRSTP